MSVTEGATQYVLGTTLRHSASGNVTQIKLLCTDCKCHEVIYVRDFGWSKNNNNYINYSKPLLTVTFLTKNFTHICKYYKKPVVIYFVQMKDNEHQQRFFCEISIFSCIFVQKLFTVVNIYFCLTMSPRRHLSET